MLYTKKLNIENLWEFWKQISQTKHIICTSLSIYITYKLGYIGSYKYVLSYEFCNYLQWTLMNLKLMKWKHIDYNENTSKFFF